MYANKKQLKRTSSSLVDWYQQNKRDLPWRSTQEPYKIWLSEVILQQTTVAQGTQYYLSFLETYPNLHSLASADLDDILKLWQGLGYYSRARNLHTSAKFIVKELNGVFPSSYEELLKLKGVGPYTAAAIASFSFKQNTPVVDGNVSRFITRFYGIDEPIDKTSVLKNIRHIGQLLIDHQEPDVFNQAIMEFGALLCKPKKPLCHLCPLSSFCVAKKENLVSRLPYKSKKVKKRNRYFLYSFYIIDNEKTIIQKRREKDIWNSLYEFPLIEYENKMEWSDKINSNGSFNYEEVSSSKIYKHMLTHQVIYAQFVKYHISMQGENTEILDRLSNHQKIVELKELDKYAWPRLIDLYLNDLSITLF